MTMTKKHYLSAFKLCASLSNPSLNSSLDGRRRREKTHEASDKQQSVLATTVVAVKPANDSSESSPVARRPRYRDFRRERPSPALEAGARKVETNRGDITTKVEKNFDAAGRLIVPPINPRLVARAAKLARAMAREVVVSKKAPSSSPSPSPTRSKKVSPPAPCRSCGRTDLPERFHTHPPVDAKVKKETTQYCPHSAFTFSLIY
jgi:hypothetical protein